MSVAATPGTYLVELFPWMLHISETLVLVLAVFLTQSFGAASGSQSGSTAAGGISNNTMPCSRRLFKRVRSDMLKGSERPSLSATLSQNSDRNQFSIKKWLGSRWHHSVYHLILSKDISLISFNSATGAEMTYTTMHWWALAMITHWEVQRRALPHTTAEDDWYDENAL
ncbi:hypothetical protein EDB83DRAFT_70702 [Lactarius deliciosus]|nr:hypothetical protein EDB83DRAFT_70702 [Lactarius deliciosus]